MIETYWALGILRIRPESPQRKKLLSELIFDGRKASSDTDF
jgi:hypothetical protein